MCRKRSFSTHRGAAILAVSFDKLQWSHAHRSRLRYEAVRPGRTNDRFPPLIHSTKVANTRLASLAV